MTNYFVRHFGIHILFLKRRNKKYVVKKGFAISEIHCMCICVVCFTRRLIMIYYLIKRLHKHCQLRIAFLCQKFKDCMRKLTIVDDTLEKLGIITDYKKLRTRIEWIILIWSVLSILQNFSDSIWWNELYNIGRAIYIPFMLNYCYHVALLDDLTFTSIVL